MRSFRTSIDHHDEKVQYHGQSDPHTPGRHRFWSSYCTSSSQWSNLVRKLPRACPTLPTVSAQCFIALKLMLMGSRYHFCTNLVLEARACPCPYFLVEVVPRGEIFINLSDPKHVVELLGCSDGLGMVITTRMLRWDAFDGL